MPSICVALWVFQIKIDPNSRPFDFFPVDIKFDCGIVSCYCDGEISLNQKQEITVIKLDNLDSSL